MRQTPWKPSQPATKSQSNSCGSPSFVNETTGDVIREPRGGDVADLEVQRTAALQPRLDQVLHDLVLAVDRDRAATGQLRHVDAMTAAVEGEVNAGVPHTLTPQAVPDAGRGHEVDGALLEHAGTDAFDDVVPAAILEDEGVDSPEMEKVAQHQPRRARADDSHLSPHYRHQWLVSKQQEKERRGEIKRFSPSPLLLLLLGAAVVQR